MDLIMSHVAADFDALSCMVAARKLYPKARMALAGAPEPSVREFLTLHRAHFPIEQASDLVDEPLERLILVDTRNPSRLGPFRQRVHDPNLIVHIYDHHPAVAESIRGDLEVVKACGAAITVVLEELRERHLSLSELEATLCLLGIYEETGNLTFPDTTPADMRMAAWLLEQGANLTLVPRFVHQTLTFEQRRLLEELLQASNMRRIHGFQVMLAEAERKHYIPDLGLLTHRLLDLEQADVVVSTVRMRNRIYVVARSRENALDMARIMQKLGGGGHATAASATLTETDVLAVRRRLVEALEQFLPHNLRARDLMTQPVQCLELNGGMTVAEAGHALRELGHTAVCVRRHSRVVGMISRSDVDKALCHDLGHAPVTAYMSSPVHSVEPDTPLEEIQALLVERDIGRLPVMEHGKMVGIVSRTDILAALYGNRLRRQPPLETVPAQLLRLPGRLLDLCRTAGAVAVERGWEVYLVGGFVRDLLLGVTNVDVDLVVEGDGIAYAGELSERLGGRVHPHPKFQTAMVILPDGFKLDLATARTETYCRPAALPAVKGSTLKQDLFRRDFSINTMALRLAPDHFGQLIDPFGAQRDLEAGVIRVLHNHSFVDDPTRILRAVRFEQRLGFRIEQITEHLLRSALSQDIFAYVTPDRMRDEFRLILAEAEPVPILRRLRELGVLRCIHPALRLEARTLSKLEDVPVVIDAFPQVEAEPWRVYLLALVSRMTPEEVNELRNRYKFAAVPWPEGQEPSQLVRQLAHKNLSASQVYHILEGLSGEAILYLAILSSAGSVRGHLRQYLNELRHQKPLLRGRDLQERGYEPGPLYREILGSLLDAQLDGEVSSGEQALAWLSRQFPSAGSPPDSVEPDHRAL